MKRRWKAGLAAVLMLGASLGLAPSASASVERLDAPMHCHVLVSGTEKDANGDSKVLAQSCSRTSSLAAKRAMDSQLVQANSTARASVIIMNWYMDANRFGTSTTIWGSEGACDSTGYTVTPSAWWAGRISSVTGANSCLAFKFQPRALTGWSSTFYTPVNFLGATYNDNVGRIKTWYPY